MLILRCPACGVLADETEVSPGGEAHLARRGPGDDDVAFEAYLFSRANPRGVHLERWRHSYGCGRWFHAARCTVTMEVLGTYAADLGAPPPEILARIARRTVTRSADGMTGGSAGGKTGGIAGGAP